MARFVHCLATLLLFQGINAVTHAGEPRDAMRATHQIEVSKAVSRVVNEALLTPSAADKWLIARIESLCNQTAEQLRLEIRDGETLSVDCSPRLATSIQDFVKRIDERGIESVKVSLNVYRLTSTLLEKLKVGWQVVERAESTPLKESTETATVRESTTAARLLQAINGNPTITDVRSALRNPSLSEYTGSSKDLQRPALSQGSNWGLARTSSSQQSPVLFGILDPTDSINFTEQVKQLKIEKVFSPTLIVYNGMEASVRNMQQRAFLTNLTKKTAKILDETRELYQPVSQVVDRGLEWKLMPEVFDGRFVRVSSNLRSADVGPVQVLKLPSSEGKPHLRVQVPDIRETNVAACIDVPRSHSVIMCSFVDATNQEASVLLSHLRWRTAALGDGNLPRKVRNLLEERRTARTPGQPKDAESFFPLIK